MPNSEYVQARAVASKLVILNERAERAVTLVYELNGKLTVNEEQLQFLVQVVKDHRKQQTASNKLALVMTHRNLSLRTYKYHFLRYMCFIF